MSAQFTVERYLAEKHANSRWCTGCKADIPRPMENFYLRTLTLSTGDQVRLPRGKCIPCAIEDARKRQSDGFVPSGTPHAEAIRQSLSNRSRSPGPEPGSLDRAFFCNWQPTQPERIKRYEIL